MLSFNPKTLKPLFTKPEQKVLASWACKCAKHVLKYFEQERPKDNRPRLAIEAYLVWVKGKSKVGPVREAAWAAHAAARQAKDPKAIFAARICGQAASVPHVARHALAINYYGTKIEAAGVKGETAWQKKKLPEKLRKRVLVFGK